MEANANTSAARKLVILWGKNKRRTRTGIQATLKRVSELGRLKIDFFLFSLMFLPKITRAMVVVCCCQKYNSKKGKSVSVYIAAED